MYVLLVFLAFVVIAFVVQRAVVDFGNDKDLTFNEWIELNIKRVKNLFRKNK